ncbi:hypothetical protein [Archaeoglobus veneficus]|uniref:Uncharacterized protein n=1 Tax=Archaeoglobus veneficus (strain DSM 11195 / SNP6) TaxID=693661 RepID=F2KR55_ARCVS|nr:hypothetical protein [Archaeoglobus veneficus]AEA46692.1 hypothetical protein Arcve_0672 [Archaeoglobus veneficus SNP6]
MRFAHKYLDEVTKLNADDVATIKLPRDRFIRDVLLYFTIKIANAGAADVAVTEDQILNLIKRIRVVAGGDVTFLEVNGYRKFLMNYLEFNTKPYVNIPSSIPAGGDATFEIELPLIFATNPVNEYDVSAVIPAHLTSSLNVYIDFGNPADIDANLSLASGQVDVTIKEVYTNKAEHDKILNNLQRVIELEVEKTVDEIKSNYTFKVDLDVGNLIQKIGIFTYDGTGNLSNSIISAYKIRQNSPIDVDLEKITWKQSRAEDKRAYVLESIPDGMTIWDAQYRMGVLDTRGLKSGDVTFNANTLVSSGKVVLLHREIAPAQV